MSFLKNENIKTMYESTGNEGCLASNRITIDGKKVGYMYREIPDSSSKFPDSGWRFFAGDETEEYTDNPDNFNVFKLNTICNYDSDIVDLLDSPYGSAYIRQGNRFIKD